MVKLKDELEQIRYKGIKIFFYLKDGNPREGTIVAVKDDYFVWLCSQNNKKYIVPIAALIQVEVNIKLVGEYI
jgi:hypothetical protein